MTNGDVNLTSRAQVERYEHASHMQGGLIQDSDSPRSSSLGLSDGFIQGLWRMRQTTNINTVRGEIHGPKFDVRFQEEAVAIHRHLEELGHGIFFGGHNG
jgi:hypothetical protein